MSLSGSSKKRPDKDSDFRKMSDREIDEMIETAGIVQAKIAYSREKKKNQIIRYSKQYNAMTSMAMKYFLFSGADNAVFSPFSILMLLSIAADSVDGAARKEIFNAMGSDLTYEDHRKMVAEMQRLFTGEITDGGKAYKIVGQVTSANAACIQERIADKINPEYKGILDTFHGKIFTSGDIVKDVNAWVEKETKGMIKKVADDSMKDMLACLMNALTFEADWKDIYDEDDINEDVFTNADGSETDVDILCSTEYKYIDDKQYEGFIKQYKGEKFSFMGLLPRLKRKEEPGRIKGIPDLSELYKNVTNDEVVVGIPEFKSSYEKDLTDLCKTMGITTIFTPEADFSPMADAEIMVDSIRHKAFIEVDRKGTRAAAVTAEYCVAGCCPDFHSVWLNRPFIYAIMHNETGLPVFAGVVNNIGDEGGNED